MGDISDPKKNCALEVCCGTTNASEAMASLLIDDGVCSDYADAKRVSSWIYKHFELAEKGTLTAFKKSIARVSKA